MRTSTLEGQQLDSLEVIHVEPKPYREKCLAIDPGPTRSGVVVWDGEELFLSGCLENKEILELIKNQSLSVLLIEKPVIYSVAGESIGDTLIEVGRFYDRWSQLGRDPNKIFLLTRKEIVLFTIGSSAAGLGDAHVRAAIYDIYGQPGTKLSRNRVTYYLKKDAMAAFALAHVWSSGSITDIMRLRIECQGRKLLRKEERKRKKDSSRKLSEESIEIKLSPKKTSEVYYNAL